ncbi:ABC transporter ATP-binding protein [bacterium]|nr:ABC transporter ATP-binding protein [bacterium]
MESSKIIAPPQAVLRRYMRASLRYPFLLVGALLAPIGLQLTALATPWYMRHFFNLLAEPVGTVSRGEFLHLIYIIAGISLLGWAMRRWRGWSQVYLEVHVLQNLGQEAFAYLLDHSAHFFSSQFSGTLTRRVTKYKDAFETLFDTLVMTAIPLVVFLLGACIVLFIRNPVLGLVFAAWCLLAILFQILVTQWRQPLREMRAVADSAVVGTIADSVSNQNTVTLFSGTTHESGRFHEVLETWRKATLKSWVADENIWNVQGFLMIAVNIGMLYGAYHFWTLGQLQVGDFVLIQSYLIGTFDQIMNMNRELRRVYDAFADAGEMVAILDKPHGIADGTGAKILQVTKGTICFNDVSFYFHNDRPILQNLSVVIPGGQKVALVGPSGAGKSTITKLLLRLYDVTGGEVLIDEQSVRGVTQNSLRNAIGFVPQEPVLFHRTLLENIRYGKRDATDAEVIDAAKKAHCDEFIQNLPKKYETLVGERGVRLSGGERQRVAIARAILKNAPILVLDEATSSLDSESEALIQDSLKVLMEGKTVIVIAHRLSTITSMDRVLVIESGKVEADGTHAELLARDGLYQRLWSIQAGGFIPEEGEE